MSRPLRIPAAAAALALLALALLALAVLNSAADEPAASPDEPRPKSETKGRGGFPDLVKGLKETPGCLGVETAQTGSGKRVIFAWFANRKAAMAWYNSRMHQGIMDAAGGPTRKPLQGIDDPDKPILAIASITPSDRPRVEGIEMPISQIAIELYSPLPGGAAVGGTSAPRDLDVPGLVRHDPPAPDGEPTPDGPKP